MAESGTRQRKLQRGLVNTWKKVKPNFHPRWLAPRTDAEVRRKQVWSHIQKDRAARGPIDLKPDIVMIHVPKAAGTSVFELLHAEKAMQKLNDYRMLSSPTAEERSDVAAVSFGHMDTDSLIRAGVLSPDKLESAYTFGFVRNPYTRVASLYTYLRRQRWFPTVWSFDTFIDAIRREKPVPGPYNVIGLSQTAPMIRWMRPTLWSGPTDTFFFEDLTGAITTLRSQIGLRGDLPHLNAAKTRGRAIRASDHSIQLVRQLYRDDFVAFGYDDEPPPGVFSR